MYTSHVILLCLLSYVAGDISETLKLGQAIPGEFTGLLAPFLDGQQNVKRPRISGVKGGRPSGIKGGLSGQQIGSGTLNPSRRAPIPFGNHGDDDDENNLDRICNDAFHSFLCQPVGPRRGRIDGKLRPGARIPPGVLSGLSSNVKQVKELPNQSGGALLPTLLDEDDGRQYPQPTNSAPTIDNSGYFYPKPPKQPENVGYFYPKPQDTPNLLGNPSQVSGTVLKPTNEYLPPVTTTTLPPPTAPPTTKPPPYNILPEQTNTEQFIVNPQQSFPSSQNNGYNYEQPQYTYDKPAIQLNLPSRQTFFQETTTTPRPIIVEQTTPAYSPSVFRTISTPQPTVTPILPVFNPQYAPTNQVVYDYQRPIAVYNQPLAFPQIVANTLPPATYYPQSVSPNLVSSTVYVPPSTSILSTPVVAASNVIGSSGISLPSGGFPQATKQGLFPSPIFAPSTVPPLLDYSTTFRGQQFQFSSPRPFPTSTLKPVTYVSTTERPRITTVRPTTYRTTAAPLVSVTTLRPFVYLNQQTSTFAPYSFPTTTPKPILNFASSNDVQYSAPLRPSNGYLPPPGQPVPSAANVAPFFQPVPPQPTTTTVRPTPPPKPSNEYLPQFEGSSSNVQPNIEGGSLLAAEDDGPASNALPLPKPSQATRTTERTHTLEELCRDAFHSFLCKPIDKPRRRIDGRIRAGAKIPPNVLIGSKPSQSFSASPQFPAYNQYQATNLNSRVIQSPNGNDIFSLSASDSTNLAKHFAQQSRNSVAAQYKSPAENKSVNPIKTSTPATTSGTISTIPPTTRSTTSKPSRYTTTSALRLHLEASASAALPSEVSPNDSDPKKDKIIAASTRTGGYNYPKPPKPFTYPTTAPGYNYPKPNKPLTLPTTIRPSSTARTTRPIFGQRLPSSQKQQQNSFGQQQQQQLLDDPFDTNEISNPENGLPPASQFEIIKP